MCITLPVSKMTNIKHDYLIYVLIILMFAFGITVFLRADKIGADIAERLAEQHRGHRINRMNLGDNIPLLHEGRFWSWIRIRAALELVRAKRAQEIFGAKGEFVGIQLGHFGPLPASLDKSPLPPAELPGYKFVIPGHFERIHHALIMQIERLKDWPIACVGSAEEVRREAVSI